MAGDMANNGQFKVYSSNAKHPTRGDDTKVLQEGTGIDNFVSMLIDEVLILQSAPTESNLSVEFDYSSDQLATWMRLFDPKATFMLGFDNTTDKNITSFDFHLTTPSKWDLTFSSSPTALLFAFGDEGAKVPVPGLMPDGNLLYFGLDKSRSKVATATVKDLFRFVGLPASPPSAIENWTTSLKPESAASKHNAMWLTPSNYYQTIVRLQFTLDDPSVAVLQTVISQALKSFTFNEVDIICKKVLTRAKSGGKYIAVSDGEVMIEANCSLKPKERELKITAGIVFYVGGYDLTLRFDDQDALGVILEWLAELAGQDFKFIEALVDDEKNSPFGKNIFLRRVKIGLDASIDGLKVAFRRFSLDIEVKASFGQNPVFLLSYHWEKKQGTLQSIKGSFWNNFDSTSLRELGPAYEYINDLTPISPAPKVISIMSLLPGGNVDSLPSNIPSEISQAYIVLSTDGIAIGGTVRSTDPGDAHYPVPQLNMGWVSINGSYLWTTKKAHIRIGIMVDLTAPEYSKHQDTAVLVGSIEYNAGSWTMTASLTGLYLSTLYDFFDKSSGEGDHVTPLIDSIEIEELDLVYNYSKAGGGGGGTKKVDGSDFSFTGTILIDVLKLELDFKYGTNDWTFDASLSSKSETPSTVGQVLKHMLADPDLELPGFIDGIVLKPGTDKIQLFMEKPKSGSTDPFQFITTVNVDIDGFQVTLTFAQFHGADWGPDTPSKRLVKVAITAVPEVNVPLVGNLTQPFDEMYYMWVQDGTNRNNPRLPGLTRDEVDQLNNNKLIHDHRLVFKDKYQTHTKDDVLFTAGSHLAIVIKDAQNSPTCILDYDFKKQSQSPNPKSFAQEAMLQEEENPPEKEPDSDGDSSTAPFKKKAGPLSISNIGLKYADKMLHIRFDATMELGPISLALLGFSINVRLTSLNLKSVEPLLPSLEGFIVAFEKPPLTIAGVIRHGNDPGIDYYAGGLIVGWVPYQLEAAGFYGDCKPKGAAPFKSVFVFARLDGPLFSLEFAEISGVTGGFGYNSDAKFPTPDQITNYPFIDQNQLGDAKDALATLEKLTDPSGAGWFRHLNGTYWAAAGMKIDAFQMIALDAVIVVEFGNAIKLGIFGVALVDIPDSLSKWKFAHVELGIAIVVDFDYGVLKAEAQLSNRSYILDQNCHLTGGFALYYWFDAPHADRNNIGDFVFTLGGYHQAFDVPIGWPKPDRLRIAWSLGSNISIAGEAYFAITPKVCMGGGRLRASYQAGPIKAWFDAFADFLINYKPFHFLAKAGIDVGVQFSARILFIHVCIGVEISADLYLWGPPVAGQVDVDLKVHKFTIHFGAEKHDPDPVDLDAFYNLVLQESSKNTQAQSSVEQSRIRELTDIEAEDGTINFNRMPKDQGHTFLAQSGLMNDSSDPSRTQNEQWVVRGGTFSFVVGCKMVIDTGAIYSNDDTEPVASVTSRTEAIYAKPMHLSGNDCLDSSLKVTIKQPESYQWGIYQQYKSVPTGLWGEYKSGKDPNQGNGNNNISSLLDADNSGAKLMTGILVTAPPPILSQDRIKKFKILEATLRRIKAGRAFPKEVPCYDDWVPDKPAKGVKQWDDVHDKWKTPMWDDDNKASEKTMSDKDTASGDASKEMMSEKIGEEDTVSQSSDTKDFQTQFVQLWAKAFKWDETLSSIARLPKNMDRRFKEVFVAAPLMTK